MSHIGYINTMYQPNYKKELVATFYLEPEAAFNEAAEAVAGESSIGSWTDLGTLSMKVANRLKATVFYLNQKQKIVKIAYPLALFELASIPQFLSSVGGNIFSMKAVKNLRLMDVEFPEKYINSFQGPAFGIEGIRQYLKNQDRIILGSIIKPKVGLNPDEQAALSYDLWTNGIDLVKDDENLTSMVFNDFYERAKKVLAALKKAERKTNAKKIYSCNVTAPPDEMLKRALYVKEQGGKCVMVDIVSMGLDNVQYLRKQKLGLIIHGHRAGHSTFSRNPKHGISMLVLAKLSRLAGIDQLHTGTVVGKMEGSADEVLTINEILREDFGHYHVLRENWAKVKPCLPIASGGMHPGLLPKLAEILGSNLVANFGAGIHGHRDGSIAGAKACYQASEAVAKGIALKDFAADHPELKVALEQWGGVKYKFER
jgi:ribulose-bisphosphate carboxylase large chain